MLNKQNPSYNTGVKEDEQKLQERKQAGKPGSKGDGAQFKPEERSKKTQPATKSHDKSCSSMREEEEEE